MVVMTGHVVQVYIVTVLPAAGTPPVQLAGLCQLLLPAAPVQIDWEKRVGKNRLVKNRIVITLRAIWVKVFVRFFMAGKLKAKEVHFTLPLHPFNMEVGEIRFDGCMVKVQK